MSEIRPDEFVADERYGLRVVKCVRGKGRWVYATGESEPQPGVSRGVPIVTASERLLLGRDSELVGVFVADFPRIVSVPRYRFMLTTGSGLAA